MRRRRRCGLHGVPALWSSAQRRVRQVLEAASARMAVLPVLCDDTGDQTVQEEAARTGKAARTAWIERCRIQDSESVKTHYDLIGIKPAAEADEVKRAFRREIARYHPDKVQHLGTEFQEIAATRAAALTEAYRVLMDTQLRERYDAALQQHVVPAEPPPARSTPESPHDAPAAGNGFTRPVESGRSRDQADAVSFVRRIVSARLTDAVVASGGTMLKV